MKIQIIVGDDSPILEEYASAAIQHGKATSRSDYAIASLGTDALLRIYRELKGRGAEAQRALQSLLGHSNKSVRIWAATHVLEVCPEDGQRVLQEEAQEDDVLAIDAWMALESWRASLHRL
jgi:hypothetical protein